MQATAAGLRARELRAVSAGMLVAAVALPLVPHPDIACPLRAATGIPCPFCGMTRGVVAAVHGHLATALTFNPGALVVLALALAAIVRPAWLLPSRLPPAWTVAVALGALWVWNIGFNPTFHQLLLR